MVDPEARIRNTDDVAAITDVVEQYADALEALDTERIRELVSTDYYENGGTTDRTTDDYGYAGLTALMATVQEHVLDVRVELAVNEIRVADDRAEVLYEYAITMLYNADDEDRWQTARDFSRFEMQREAGRWYITGGL